MSIDEAAFAHDLKTLSKPDLLKKYPAAKLHPDVEIMVEVMGDEIGKVRGELGKRLDALEEQIRDLAQDRRGTVLSSRELRADIERTVADLGDEISRLRQELNAMRAENDILRQCLSPKSTIKAADAVSMLRSVR